MTTFLSYKDVHSNKNFPIEKKNFNRFFKLLFLKNKVHIASLFFLLKICPQCHLNFMTT